MLPSPAELVAELPCTDAQTDFVTQARRELHAIIHGEDSRLIAVVGPCSIHDLKAGREYAAQLKVLADELSDRLLILMRVYFEKPRTTLGWKGLIMDPHLNGTCDIPAGLRIAREFLGEMLELGLPTATELLDPITPQQRHHRNGSGRGRPKYGHRRRLLLHHRSDGARRRLDCRRNHPRQTRAGRSTAYYFVAGNSF